MTVSVKDWAKFQHYANRRPPWVKLYRDLLDDPEWYALPGETAKVLVMCWLLASDGTATDGALPEMKELIFRLRMKESEIHKHFALLSHWLVQDASAPLASCVQDASPEKSRVEKKRVESDAAREMPQSIAEAFAEFEQMRREMKKPLTPTSKQKILKKLSGFPVDIACAMLAQSVENGWLGVFDLKKLNGKPARPQKPSSEYAG